MKLLYLNLEQWLQEVGMVSLFRRVLVSYLGRMDGDVIRMEGCHGAVTGAAPPAQI